MAKFLIRFLLAFIIFLTSFHPSAYAEKKVDVMKIAIPKDENTLTPYTYVTGYPGLDLVHLVYDTLLQLDEKNTPQPWLAKDYKVSEDGKTYEFTLHENIKWHDGKPLTADDIKFTVDYFIKNPKSRFTNPLKVIQEVSITDDSHFKFILSEADPNFLIQPLADVPILPKHIWEAVSNPNEATNAIGSGPYILENYKTGQFYKMKANKDYFKGASPVQQLIFPIIEDPTAMFTALKAKEVDAISSSITPEVVSEFKSNPNLKIEEGPGFSTTLFQFNAEKYPMSEKSFRQAVAYAIDNQYLVDTVTLGFAQTGSPGFIHPSSPFYNKDLSFKPDMNKAKEILDQAGFVDKDGDGFREGANGEKIKLVNLVYSTSPLRIRTAEIITEWLKDIGINVEVRAMDATTVDSLVWPDFDVSKGRNFDLALWSWSNTMQLFPDRMIELFHSDPSIGSVNIGGYKNKEFDDLSKELSQTYESSKRTEIIKNMQEFVADEFPIVPLYHDKIVNAYTPAVYDQFSFQEGKGIINKLSFVPSSQSKTATKNTSGNNQSGEVKTDTENKGSNNSLFFLVGFIVLLIAGGIFLKQKSNKNTDV
jgi:peptide/nickel transport system substrate-binding protein